MGSRVAVVVFDIGETLVDETSSWNAWADYLGIPRFTLNALVGVCIAQGRDHRDAFTMMGFDFATEAARRDTAGEAVPWGLQDFYPDAVPCLQELHALGLRVGLAGNQPAAAEQVLEALGLPVAFIASSARWGVAKPSPAFFEKVVEAAGVAAAQIAYVGDRLDNDVLPARAAGMTAVLLRRGPWGYLHATQPDVARAHHVIDSLHTLSARLLLAD